MSILPSSFLIRFLSLTTIVSATACGQTGMETREWTLTIPPFPVETGTEVQRCYYFKFPASRDVDLSSLAMTTEAGSHHFQVYVADDEDYPDGFSEECFRIVDFSRWKMIFATQQKDMTWSLPSGIGLRVNAGQQVMIQTHYVNVGELLTPSGVGGGTLTFREAADPVSGYMGAVFAVNYDIHLPPAEVTRVEADCFLPRPALVGAVTGHYHFFGSRFQAMVRDAEGEMSSPFYEASDFNDLSFETWSPSLAPAVRSGEAIRWTCDYVNTLDTELTFGAKETDHEHCNMFLFYFPAAPQEFVNCTKNDRDGNNTQDNSG